jgi:penicillin amidase
MLERTFRDKLGPDLYKQYLGVYARGALYELVRTPDHPWFVVLSDTAHHGRDDLAALALDDALDDLTKKLGPDVAAWKWGDLHRVTFDHPLGQVLPFVFNIGPTANDGAFYTVDNAPFDMKKPYAQGTHPSMRMVVDLADLEATRVIYATGQAGQPFAPHWGDMTKPYFEGGYVTLRFATAKQGPSEGTLTLERR